MEIEKACSLLSVTADNTVDEIVTAAYVVIDDAILNANLTAVVAAYRAMTTLLKAGGQTTPAEVDRYLGEASVVASQVKVVVDRKQFEVARHNRRAHHAKRVIADSTAAIADEQKVLDGIPAARAASKLQHGLAKSALLSELAAMRATAPNE